MQSNTILLDVDGVVADTHLEWYAKYNADYNDDLTPKRVTSWNLHEFVKPECGKKIYEYLVPSLYDNVKPAAGALEYVNYARTFYRVIFVTSVYHEAGAKFKWLNNHKFFDGVEHPKMDYVEASDKSIIRGDMLVDDGLHNLVTFSGYKVVFDQPWNHAAPDGIERVMNFKELTYLTMSSAWRKQ